MNDTKLHIISVDDEKDLNVLFKHFFRNEIKSGELTLDFVDNAKQCLEFLEKFDQNNRIVVLSDINMPDVSGVELTKLINEKFPKTEVYLVTAYEKEHLKDNIKENINIKGVIHKPIDFESLKTDIGL